MKKTFVPLTIQKLHFYILHIHYTVSEIFQAIYVLIWMKTVYI